MIRRAAVAVGGFALLAAGLVLMVLPGPGIPLVVAGLALLSHEFVWARRLRITVLRRAERVAPASRGTRIALLAASLATAVAATVAVSLFGIPL